MTKLTVAVISLANASEYRERPCCSDDRQTNGETHDEADSCCHQSSERARIQTNSFTCVISGFCRAVNEVLALPRCYAAYIGL